MQVVELGQVGRAADPAGLSAFYAHSQQGARFGDAGALTEAFLQAGDSKVCPCKSLHSWPRVHTVNPSFLPEIKEYPVSPSVHPIALDSLLYFATSGGQTRQ